MKILHCCLANFYIDNYSYQENILPKIHKIMGYEVEILASTETYIDNIKLGYIDEGTYKTDYGIPITRIPYIKWLPHIVVRKIRIYNKLDDYLKNSRPDIIFMHDCQFLSIKSFVKYVKKYNVKIFIDCHTDFVNSGQNWISKNILHKIIYKNCAKSIEKYTEKFYGTLPLRIEYLNEVYGINKDKIELLPFGVDDTLFKWSDRDNIRTNIRIKMNIGTNDIVFITGGKIDKRKNIHLLGSAFVDVVEQYGYNDVKLIIFGKPDDELSDEIRRISMHPSVRYIKWIASDKLYTYFFASDIAFFPGTHSVLWEEAVGLGLPCIFLRWQGIEHVDLGGNCIFIDKGKYLDIKNAILTILKNDKNMLENMKTNALLKGPSIFCYSEIAKKAINV